MQKSIIAIALALTLSCAFAAYSPITAGYVKAPQSVAGDNESNYTNASSLTLVSANAGELDLYGSNTTSNSTFLGTWSAALRKLDGKTLLSGTNYSTISFTGSAAQTYIINGFAVSFNKENDTNSVPQVAVYQAPVTGGAALAKIFVTSNNQSSWNPSVITYSVISKNVYVFYLAKNTSNITYQVNVTSFTLGGAKGTLDFNLTTAYTLGSLNVAWGEALGSNQVFANWLEGNALKDAAVDVTKGTYTVNTVGGAWNSSLTCTAYSTDKKWYGDLCWYNYADANFTTTTYYIRSNTTNLVQLYANNTNIATYTGVYPYGPYIAITYSDYNVTAVNRTTLSYDIWNLDTGAINRNKTAFITYDAGSSTTVLPFRVISGGLYTIAYNNELNGTTTYHQGIQVGLVLGSSTLTSVFGFILTIVAGLLLF